MVGSKGQARVGREGEGRGEGIDSDAAQLNGFDDVATADRTALASWLPSRPMAIGLSSRLSPASSNLRSPLLSLTQPFPCSSSPVRLGVGRGERQTCHAFRLKRRTRIPSRSSALSDSALLTAHWQIGDHRAYTRRHRHAEAHDLAASVGGRRTHDEKNLDRNWGAERK